eukprot:scaffold318287_cov35-Tisochrysis_lutea.AAC.3
MREKNRRHLRRDFIEEEDGAELSEEAPGNAAPQRWEATLSHKHIGCLTIAFETDLLDVALHTRLDRIRWVRGERADRPRNKGGG